MQAGKNVQFKKCERKLCRQCGKEIDVSARFCTQCGASINENQCTDNVIDTEKILEQSEKKYFSTKGKIAFCCLILAIGILGGCIYNVYLSNCYKNVINQYMGELCNRKDAETILSLSRDWMVSNWAADKGMSVPEYTDYVQKKIDQGMGMWNIDIEWDILDAENIDVKEFYARNTGTVYVEVIEAKNVSIRMKMTVLGESEIENCQIKVIRVGKEWYIASPPV